MSTRAACDTPHLSVKQSSTSALVLACISLQAQHVKKLRANLQEKMRVQALQPHHTARHLGGNKLQNAIG